MKKPPRPGLLFRLRQQPRRMEPPPRDDGCRWTELPFVSPPSAMASDTRVVTRRQMEAETVLFAEGFAVAA